MRRVAGVWHVAFFAALAALGAARTVDTKGAIEELLTQPFGAVLLWLVAIGLFAHVAWRLTQGLGDTDRHGDDAKGLLIRGGLLGSASSICCWRCSRWD